jgi:hypothetical protein
MNVFAMWGSMNNTERLVNLITRPFGLDIVVERHCGWLDLKNYDLSMEHRTSELDEVWEFWVGPLNVLIGRE